MIEKNERGTLNIEKMNSKELKQEFPKLHELFQSDDWEEKIKSKLLELAEKFSEFVYSESPAYSCFYHQGPEDGPDNDGCIFGQAFQALGVPKEELSKVDKDIGDLVRAFGHECPYGWPSVQARQDQCHSWGIAIEPLNYPVH